MNNEVHRVTNAEPILRRHGTLEVLADDAADAIDERVRTAVLLRLCVARLISLEVRHARLSECQMPGLAPCVRLFRTHNSRFAGANATAILRAACRC